MCQPAPHLGTSRDTERDTGAESTCVSPLPPRRGKEHGPLPQSDVPLLGDLM
jgi:hypothetical protein